MEEQGASAASDISVGQMRERTELEENEQQKTRCVKTCKQLFIEKIKSSF